MYLYLIYNHTYNYTLEKNTVYFLSMLDSMVRGGSEITNIENNYVVNYNFLASRSKAIIT